MTTQYYTKRSVIYYALSDFNYLWLYQYEGMGVIDFVALCINHRRGDVFLTSCDVL